MASETPSGLPEPVASEDGLVLDLETDMEAENEQNCREWENLLDEVDSHEYYPDGWSCPFFADINAPTEEELERSRAIEWRWCQWIVLPPKREGSLRCHCLLCMLLKSQADQFNTIDIRLLPSDGAGTTINTMFYGYLDQIVKHVVYVDEDAGNDVHHIIKPEVDCPHRTNGTCNICNMIHEEMITYCDRYIEHQRQFFFTQYIDDSNK